MMPKPYNFAVQQNGKSAELVASSGSQDENERISRKRLNAE